MGNNKITFELIEQLLAEDGVIAAEELTTDAMLTKIKEHFDFTIK